MNQFEEFLKGIEKRLKLKDFSEEKIQVKLDSMRREYDSVFNMPDENEEDYELEPLDETPEIEEESPSFSIVSEMRDEVDGEPNFFKLHKNLSAEERILSWQNFYRNKNVFTDEDSPVEDKKINDRGAFGRTALHEAVLAGDANKVEELISSGIDVKIADNNGFTAFRTCLFEGNDQILEVFKKHGINE